MMKSKSNPEGDCESVDRGLSDRDEISGNWI